jgi:Cu-Zn family superoxide dismutase
VSGRMMRISGFALATLLAVGCRHLPGVARRVAVANVNLVSPTGAPRGGGVIWQDPEGRVHLDLQLRGLPPGTHGMHFHSVGRCEGGTAAPFTSAGLHFNPHGRRHGLSSVDGPHAGDLPNVVVRGDGTARVDVTTDRVSLTTGRTNLFDADGAALMVHAAADDQITDPGGNAGGRIACGVVTK